MKGSSYESCLEIEYGLKNKVTLKDAESLKGGMSGLQIHRDWHRERSPSMGAGQTGLRPFYLARQNPSVWRGEVGNT